MKTTVPAFSAIVQRIRTHVRPALARTGRGALALVVALAALIGVQHVSRGTSVRHVQGVGADGTPVTPGEPLLVAHRIDESGLAQLATER